jgi:hypothetical protein
LAPGVRSGARFAGWLAVTLLGWSASLQLTDAPPTVAYQHLAFAPGNPVHWIAVSVCVLQLLLVLTVGRHHLAAIVHWCRANLRPWGLVVLPLLLILPAAAPSRDPGFYLTELGISSLLQLLSLVSLVAAVRSLPVKGWEFATTVTDRVLGPAGIAGPKRIDAWVLRVAATAVAIAAILVAFVYEAHPHVPDEIAYLLHARYLAEGMLTMPLPPVPPAFNLDLMHYEPTRWFSPLPPGWPMVLALGAWLGQPWLVNPVLGGLAIVLTYLLVGRLADARETRLTTLLLAASPWFLFMSMNLMTHTLTLVGALAAALGVAVSREKGSWVPAFAGGLALGVVALARPLEGLVTALLLGFWSLGARGKRVRLAPSIALVAGTLITGLLDRPYNAAITGSSSVFPVMAYVDKYHAPGSNSMGFGANRGLGWSGLDPFPGHDAKDVVINAALNTSQINTELTGWPIGGVVLVSLALILGTTRPSRTDWWYVAVITTVIGAHTFYWFSGGPDFGARYWYLVIVPCCALLARGITRLDETRTSALVPPTAARSVALLLMVSALAVFIPWRSAGKYHHYRGMRPDVRQLAKQYDFGRSLVLVRGQQRPDYASAAVYNPIDLHADAPIYAWDGSPEIRTRLLNAYPDRTVWILDGPSVTRGAFRVAAGPLDPAAARVTPIVPLETGRAPYDPVNPPRRRVTP